MPLEDDLNREFAPAWRPDPGDAVIGEVAEISSREGGYGAYPIITLTVADGTRLAVHAFHSVLLSELKKIKPQVGHRIGIKYVGRPQGKNYDVYRVATENPPDVDWETPGDPGQGFQPHDPMDAFQPQSVPSGVKGANGDDVPF